MTKRLSPLVFFGTEDFSAQILDELIKAKIPIELVITKSDFKKGRGKQLHSPAVKLLADLHSIPVKQVSSQKDLEEAVESSHKQTGALASFGMIIPESIIKKFNNGILNVHPSLLPSYRGPSPIETAILNDDSYTGVTIMKLASKIDAGPIYSKQKISLNKSESKTYLYKKLAEIGSKMLIQTIEQLNLQPEAKPQDETKATYTKLLLKSDGFIKPERFTARQLYNQVRAYQNYPKPKYNFFGHSVIILEAFDSDNASELSVQGSDGRYLNIITLQSPSGKSMTSSEFIRGYKLSN